MQADAQEYITRKQRNRWNIRCLRSTSTHDPSTLQPDWCCIYTIGIHESMMHKRCRPLEVADVFVTLHSTNISPPTTTTTLSLVTTPPPDTIRAPVHEDKDVTDGWRGACRNWDSHHYLYDRNRSHGFIVPPGPGSILSLLLAHVPPNAFTTMEEN